MDPLLKAAQKEAKQAIAETRTLLRRGKRVISDENRRAIEEAIAEVQRFEGSSAGLRGKLRALNELVDKHLGFARKSKAREYAESIGFAILIALIIRSFVFEPFRIPSPSMVPTLLVGDRLFVSKSRYGIRVPLSSNYILNWRAPKVGDIVVFDFPRREALTRDRMGHIMQRLDFVDGVYPASLTDLQATRAGGVLSDLDLSDAWGTPFHYEAIDGGRDFALTSFGPDKQAGTPDDITRSAVEISFVSFPDMRRPHGESLVHRCPVDPGSLSSAKTYIKRIIGLPGDVVEIRNNVLFLNDTAVPQQLLQEEAPREQHGVVLTPTLLTETLPGGPSYTIRTLFDDENFGPVTVPEGQFLGIGDNRDESSDGRCWGYVPLSNIKGQARFVLFSASPGGGFEKGRFFAPLR